MALHWKDSAFTTPSLTPRPQNRPLKIGKLTPCKIPGATGSAGRCDPGVGRFTDPHPLTCFFHTLSPLPNVWVMFAILGPLQIRPISGGKFRFPSRLIPCLNALPLPNRQGLLFPFLPISGFSQPPLSEWRRNQLSLAWGWLLSPDSLTTGSHWPNRAGLLLRWCRSPTPPSDRPRIATQGRVWFHRLFLLAFLGGSPASWRSRL